MRGKSARPEERIQLCAVICRKYQLCDAAGFRVRFPKAPERVLRASWAEAERKIRHQHIIKDASRIGMAEISEAERMAAAIPADEIAMYAYLQIEFDPQALPLREEQIERRSRRLVAERYLDVQQRKVQMQFRTRKRRKFLVGVSLSSSLVIALFASRILDGFTPVEELAQKLYTESVYEYDGSICKDGVVRQSQGQGTCSWHGGVLRKFCKGEHTKTLEECRAEAEALSWRE